MKTKKQENQETRNTKKRETPSNIKHKETQNTKQYETPRNKKYPKCILPPHMLRTWPTVYINAV